jgi:hypothetical protein
MLEHFKIHEIQVKNHKILHLPYYITERRLFPLSLGFFSERIIAIQECFVNLAQSHDIALWVLH